MLRKLDLKTPLLGPGAAGEYVQNQRGTVYDLDVLAKGVFQVALLRWSKLIVQDQRVESPANDPQLLYLALPQIGVPGLVQVLGDRNPPLPLRRSEPAAPAQTGNPATTMRNEPA